MADRSHHVHTIMENQTAFDLNRQIQQWRENLGRSPAFRPENLNELEAHLRDSIGWLQARGLTADEAFLVATRRVGPDGALAAEFGKVNRREVWLRRLLWMLVGLQLWEVLFGFMTSLAGMGSMYVLAGWLKAVPDHQVLPAMVVSGGGQLLALAASVGICWWLVVPLWPRLGGWTNRWLSKHGVLMTAGLILAAIVGVLAFEALPVVFQMLLAKTLPGHDYSRVMVLENYTYPVVVIIHTVVLFVLTLMVARRRFHLRNASLMTTELAGGGRSGRAGQTAFDLDRQIQEWCENAGRSPDVARESLNQRESRLREMATGLQACGLTAAESFWVAARRLGDRPRCGAEFGQPPALSTWPDRVFWMLLGLQFYGFVYHGVNRLTMTASEFALSGWSSFMDWHAGGPLLALSVPVGLLTLVHLLSLGGSLALCWWLFVRRGQYWGAWLDRWFRRDVYLVPAGVLLAILQVGSLLPVFCSGLLARFQGGRVQDALTMSQALSQLLVGVCQPAVLMTLTLILARKRLNLVKAE